MRFWLLSCNFFQNSNGTTEKDAVSQSKGISKIGTSSLDSSGGGKGGKE